MRTPGPVESDLGWTLGAVLRTYLKTTTDIVESVPGGARGYQVLSTAAGEPGSQLALARHLGVDRTVMTYLLDDLESAGLVERKPDPADRRLRRVTLTESGRDHLCDLEQQLNCAEARLLAPLTPPEQKQFREMLHRLALGATQPGENACTVVDEAKKLQDSA